MCEDWVDAEDMEEEFEQFLGEQPGTVTAKELAKCWNTLAKKHGWDDRLKAFEKKEARNGK